MSIFLWVLVGLVGLGYVFFNLILALEAAHDDEPWYTVILLAVLGLPVVAIGQFIMWLRDRGEKRKEKSG